MKKNGTLTQIYYAFFRPKIGKVCILMLVIFGGVIIGNLSPLIYGKMVDCINGINSKDLLKLMIIYCMVTVITEVFAIVEKYLGEQFSFNTISKVQISLFNKILNAKFSEIEKYTNGELVSRMLGDADAIITFFLGLFTSSSQVIVNLILSLSYIFSISSKLSNITFFYIPASFIVSVFSRKLYRTILSYRKILEDKNYSFLSQAFSNIIGIKSFNLEGLLDKDHREIIEQRWILIKKEIRGKSIVSIFDKLIGLCASMYVIYCSAMLVRQNVLTVGDMVAFNTYINLLYSAIGTLYSFRVNQGAMKVHADRICEILDVKDERSDIKDSKLDIVCGGDTTIRYKNISFRYSKEQPIILKDISLSITSNGVYGFVGLNGSGKSTLFKLLSKLYEPYNGDIEINGLNIREWPLNKLRKTITFIQNDNFFFKDTIYRNIIFSNPSSSKSEVIDACKKVYIYDQIMAMPQQFDTIIGENGYTLSDGQKQKIGLVRAILRKSQIIILDETTSHLDQVSSKEVLNIIKQLKEKAVVIIISHEPSVIISCDYVFVLDDGYIVDKGMPDMLKATNRLFARLMAQGG